MAREAMETMKLPEFTSTLFKSIRNRGNITASTPKLDAEQMKEAIDTAIEFDNLIAMPGWEKAMKFCVAQVNGEIAEATQYKYEPTRQSVHVVRWDAKRELLDSLIGYINGQQKIRDEIIEQVRQDGRELQDVT